MTAWRIGGFRLISTSQWGNPSGSPSSIPMPHPSPFTNISIKKWHLHQLFDPGEESFGSTPAMSPRRPLQSAISVLMHLSPRTQQIWSTFILLTLGRTAVVKPGLKLERSQLKLIEYQLQMFQRATSNAQNRTTWLSFCSPLANSQNMPGGPGASVTPNQSQNSRRVAAKTQSTWMSTYVYYTWPWLSKDIKRIVQGPRLFKTIYFQYTRYSRVVSCQPNLITKPRQADVVLGHANVKIIMIVKYNIMGIMMTKMDNPWKSHKQLELYCYIVDPCPKYKPLVLFSQILQRYWVQLPSVANIWHGADAKLLTKLILYAALPLMYWGWESVMLKQPRPFLWILRRSLTCRNPSILGSKGCD